MTTPKRLTEDEFAQVNLMWKSSIEIHGNLSGVAGLFNHIAALEAELAEAKADNAAILKAFTELLVRWGGAFKSAMGIGNPMTCTEDAISFGTRMSQIEKAAHPGAAMLEETKGLRKEIADLRSCPPLSLDTPTPSE